MRGFVVMFILAGSLPTAACNRQAEEAPAPAATAAADTPAPRPAAPTTTAPATTQPATTQPTTTAPETRAAGLPPWHPPLDPRTARFVGLVGDKPATWIEHPPQDRMRVANYTVPGRDGAEAAHVVVFYFGPAQGGPIDSNIDRWQSQFEPDENGDLVEPLISRFEADGMPVTLVELAGSWMKMGATWYTPDQLFIAAIIESPQGNIFVRFAGQTATVETNRADFVNMIRSLRKEGT